MDGSGLGRIIPALAGNTDAALGSPRRHPDHPRSRGEYLTVYPDENGAYGSSPLSRGIRASRQSRPVKTKDHPRSRGEYRRAPSDVTGAGWIIPALAGNTAVSWTVKVGGRGSSPLSRGILIGGRGRLVEVGIIPALAGNTSGMSPAQFRATDHPRSRGEYR